MSAWFKKKHEHEPQPHPQVDIAGSTVEVSADVIAAAEAGGTTEGTAGEPKESEADMRLLHADGAPDGTIDRAVADRQHLVQLCMYALDRARSSGVAERIEQGLADVGIRAVRPEGDRFDPAVHEAGGTIDTDDRTLDGLVAETEVVGFTDHGRLLRAPIVTVYTLKGGT
ncbi:GrpE protein [Herbihabitans rhizosphaerae]|uniref:GrpE protein n=1 Tax=Herbihabitans rhizosphaerae TaxID=1872711 RepID=A0A4Q7KP17_9PSEU|nr:nucleotide exchange factor GrpE [Herbihabitans rhizosphaerae]RZS37720.1 GrpE protein [Herbihabitans rhizosphaerae]